jgi:multidrug resistance efflux pump
MSPRDTAAEERAAGDAEDRPAAASPPRASAAARRRRIVPMLATVIAVAVAAASSWAGWNVYMAGPWTRDGTVRAYVVTMASEVAGRIVELPVADNQLVHKGDTLMVIDPTDFAIAVHRAEAAVAQAKADAQNAQAEADRRRNLSSLAVSAEEKQTFATSAASAAAAYQQALANLDQARANLERTRIVSPVNGYVTNLLAQRGDYASIGERLIAVVDADSYWVDGYFEETSLQRIHEGDPAAVKLMGYDAIIRGHVDSVARGIAVANAQADAAGLASVNPIFTWVRLAQRVPVRIHLDQVPPAVRLSAGMTATVEVDPPGARR